MKKLFVCLALAGLLCGCGESGADQQPDNGNAGLETWDPVPIVGQWRLSLIERYASDGTLEERLSVYYDPTIYAFNEAGFFAVTIPRFRILGNIHMTARTPTTPLRSGSI